MHMRLLHAIEFGLLLGASSMLAAERSVCVPDEDRRWICGDEASVQNRPPPPPPAPPPAAPLPPVLLLDPDRLFGPAPKREPTHTATNTEPVKPTEPAPTAATAPAARPEPASVAESAAVRPEPVPAMPTLPKRGSHAWQLARASSPGGFAGLLQARGINPAETRSVQTRRGDWLLLYGDFPNIDSARAAKARAGTGFAKSWADVDSEI